VNAIGFTCGTFDLLHAGHVMMLEEVRSQCGYLIVGLQTDPSIREGKSKPIQSVEERLIQLKAVRYVDEVIQYDTEDDLVELLKDVQPNIRFVGMDWKDNPNLTGGDLRYNSRDHGYSSTELKNRIKRG
jgi:glycerol-3-phosphate cytidylyltransferase